MFKLDGKTAHPRRLAYEWEFGPIQAGLEIWAGRDCEFACVNPAHLVALPKSERNRRNKTSKSPEERFWEKVDRTGGPDACWTWLAENRKSGPGTFSLNGEYVYAHRLAYEWEYGPIQAGYDIRAGRDCKSACVNPAHLVSLSKSESSRFRKTYKAIEERFWGKVDQTGGSDACWPWLAAKNGYGTGIFNFNGRSPSARRVAYQWEYGDIPAEAEIRTGRDCNPACVNPAHLVALSKPESSSRSRKHHQLTHCKNGHPFTEENSHYSGGKRNCVTCRIENYERWVARQLDEQDSPIPEPEVTLPDREPVYPELWGDRPRVIGGRVVDGKFERRFWRKADRTGGPEACWIWTGMSDHGGYGLFDIFNNKISKKRTQAHRVAYELEIGPIPEGYVIDHFRCGDKACCNPAHLEAVTAVENTRRARRQKHYCQRGHPLSEKNSYFTPNGLRSCKICRTLRYIMILRRGKEGKPSRDKKFWAKVDQSGGPNSCWPWRGRTIDVAGYGMYSTKRVHRLAWELANGRPVPDGHTIDHKCREKSCCNPDHLEPVSVEENSRRAAPFRPSRQRPTAVRFWEKVDTSGGPDACWIWPGESMTLRDSEQGKTVNPRHFIYQLKVGPVPRNKQLHSRCGNDACVNYRHLTRVQRTYRRLRRKPAPITGSKQLAFDFV